MNNQRHTVAAASQRWPWLARGHRCAHAEQIPAQTLPNASAAALYMCLRPAAVGAARPTGFTFTPTSPMASAVGAMAISAGVIDTPSGLRAGKHPHAVSTPCAACSATRNRD